MSTPSTGNEFSQSSWAMALAHSLSRDGGAARHTSRAVQAGMMHRLFPNIYGVQAMRRSSIEEFHTIIGAVKTYWALPPF